MILSERAQEILETLWGELVEKTKDICDVSILKDDDSLKELISSGYVEIKNNQVSLAQKGRQEARNCVRRHRLAERLMADVFVVNKKLVHPTSCKFEHLLHEGLDDSVCTLLGHPKTCPHGRPIPEGNCCKDVRRTPKKLIMPLSELEINKKAKVSYIHTKDHNMLQKIIAMGALPNTDIVLIQKFPSYVFQSGKSQFAIDKELASCIYTRIV